MSLRLLRRSRGVPAPPHAAASQPKALSASAKLAPKRIWPEPIVRILQVPRTNPIRSFPRRINELGLFCRTNPQYLTLVLR